MNRETKNKLNLLMAAVIEEAEKNEEFAQTIDNILNAGDTPAGEVKKPNPRQKRLFDPTPTRSSNRRDPAVLDPMDVLSRGEEELRKSLEALDEKQLKDIIADYGMDPSKLAMKWKDSERLINHIIDAAKRRASKGDAFRDAGGDSN